MKQHNRRFSRILVVVALVATVGGPQFTLLSQAHAQGPLNLRALNIEHEAKQISSLVLAQVKFFKRASEFKQRGASSASERDGFFDEGDARRADLTTLTSQLQALINKLKQRNNWNEAFDAQFLASLKSDSERSVLTQSGGARKLFEAAVGEISSLRDEIDEEVRQVKGRQTGVLRNRRDRVFAAHARPAFGKVCVLLIAAYFLASAGGHLTGPSICLLAARYNNKGCVPRLDAFGCPD